MGQPKTFYHLAAGFILFFKFKIHMHTSLSSDALRKIAERVIDPEKKSRIACDFIL